MSRRIVTSGAGLALCLALAVAILVLPRASALAAGSWSVTNLGQLLSTGNSSAGGINNSGQVVGRYYSYSAGWQGFVWDPTNGFTYLNNLPSSVTSLSRAAGINGSGDVVLNTQDSGGYTPYLGTPTVPNGSTYNWVAVGGSDSQLRATGLNDSGQVVGDSTGGTEEGFVWSSGQPTYLPSGGAANGINDSGDVAGEFVVAAGGGEDACVWSPSSSGYGSPTILSSLSDQTPYSQAYGINDNGDVVGESIAGGTTYDACLWEGGTGTPIDIGALSRVGTAGGTIESSEGQYINGNGWVVGTDTVYDANGNSSSRGWLYSGGTVEYLDALVPNSGFDRIAGTGINGAGDITGIGYGGGGIYAVVLTPPPAGGPTPELPPLALLSMLPLGLIWLRRRKGAAAA